MRRRRGAVLALAALVVAVAAGCGKSGGNGSSSSAATSSTTTGAAAVSSSIGALLPASPATLARGRTLFQSSVKGVGCSLCHSLASAESTSPIGPDLDTELTGAELRRLSDGELAQFVRDEMRVGVCPSPTDPGRCMPPGLRSGDDADAIAVFVATCGRDHGHAGCAPAPGPLRGQALAGERLYVSRGCIGCHFTVGPPSVGPTLAGLAGSKVELANGQTVVADDGYLLAAIAAPDSQIVAGYPSGLMSARVAPQHLTGAQINALVAYIKALG